MTKIINKKGIKAILLSLLAASFFVLLSLFILGCGGSGYKSIALTPIGNSTATASFVVDNSGDIAISLRGDASPAEKKFEVSTVLNGGKTNDIWVNIQNNEVLNKIGERIVGGNKIFEFEIVGPGASNIDFKSDGNVSRSINVDVEVSVINNDSINNKYGVSVDPTYRPYIVRGSSVPLVFDLGRILYNQGSGDLLSASTKNRTVTFDPNGTALAGTSIVGNQISLAYNAASSDADVMSVRIRHTTNYSAFVFYDIPIINTPVTTIQGIDGGAIVNQTANAKYDVTLFSNNEIAQMSVNIDLSAVLRQYQHRYSEIAFETEYEGPQNLFDIRLNIQPQTSVNVGAPIAGQQRIDSTKPVSLSVSAMTDRQGRGTVKVFSLVDGGAGSRVEGKLDKTRQLILEINIESLIRPSSYDITTGAFPGIVGDRAVTIYQNNPTMFAVSIEPSMEVKALSNSSGFKFILDLTHIAPAIFSRLEFTNLDLNGNVLAAAPTINGQRVQVGARFGINLKSGTISSQVPESFELYVFAIESVSGNVFEYSANKATLKIEPKIGAESITFDTSGGLTVDNLADKIVATLVIDRAQSPTSVPIFFTTTPTVSAISFRYQDVSMSQILSFDKPILHTDENKFELLINRGLQDPPGIVILIADVPSLLKPVEIRIEVVSLPTKVEKTRLAFYNTPNVPIGQATGDAVMPDSPMLEVGGQMYLNNLVYNQEQTTGAKFTTIYATKISIKNRLTSTDSWSSPVTITGQSEIANNGRISAQFSYSRQGIILTGGPTSGTVRVQVWFEDQLGNTNNTHTGESYTTTFDILVTRTPRRQDIVIKQNGDTVADKATIIGRNPNVDSKNLSNDIIAISLEGFDANEIEANKIRFRWSLESHANEWLSWIGRGASNDLAGGFSTDRVAFEFFAIKNPSLITGAIKIDLTFTILWGNGEDNYLTRTITIVIEPRNYSNTIEILRDGVYVDVAEANNMYFDARKGFLPITLSARALAANGNLATDSGVIFKVSSGGSVISIEDNVLTILGAGSAVIEMSGADGGIIPDPRFRYIYIYVANGTVANPYLISSASELAAAASVAAPNNYFRLTNSIDLYNSGWVSKDFLGSLDGNGFTISNLSTRLFNTVGGYIKNITVSHSNITAPAATFGGVIANSISNRAESGNINLIAIGLSQLTTTGGTLAMESMDKRLNAFLLIAPNLGTAGAGQWTHAAKDYEVNTVLNGDHIASKGKTNISLGATGAGSISYTIVNKAYTFLIPTISMSELFDIKIYATAAGGGGLLPNEAYSITTNRGEQVTVFGGQVMLNNFTFGEVIFTVSHPNIAFDSSLHRFSIFLASNTFYRDFTTTNATGELIQKPREIDIIRTHDDNYLAELAAHKTKVEQPFAVSFAYVGTLVKNNKTLYEYKEVVYIQSLGATVGKVFERQVIVNPIEAVTTFFADVGGWQFTPESPKMTHVFDRLQDIIITIRYSSTIDTDMPTVQSLDKNNYVLDKNGNKIFLLRNVSQSIVDGELYTFRFSPVAIGASSIIFIPSDINLRGASGNSLEIRFNIIDNGITLVNSYVVNSLIDANQDPAALVIGARNALLPTTNRTNVGHANNLVLEIVPMETLLDNDGEPINSDPIVVTGVQALGSRPIYTEGISQGKKEDYYERGGEGTLLPALNLGYMSFLDINQLSEQQRHAFFNASVDGKNTDFWFLPFWFDITSNNISVSIGQVYEFEVRVTWSNDQTFIYKTKFAVDYALVVMAEHVFSTPTPEESGEWLAPYREVIIGNTYEVKLTHIENAVATIPVEINYSISEQAAPNGMVSASGLVPGETFKKAEVSVISNRLTLKILSADPTNFYLRIWVTQTVAGVQTISNVVEFSYMPVLYGLRGLHFARPSDVSAQGLPAVTASGSYGYTSGGTFPQPPSINHFLQVKPTVVYSQNADIAKQGYEAVNGLTASLNTEATLHNMLSYLYRDPVTREAVDYRPIEFGLYNKDSGLMSKDSDFISVLLMPNTSTDTRAKWMDINYRIGYGTMDYSLDASWFSLNANREWVYSGEIPPENETTRRQTDKFDFTFVIKPGPNEDNPFPIRTAQELRSYLNINGNRENGTENNVQGMHLVLVNDIVIDASWWDGVNSIEANFASLDGNEHNIILADKAFNGFEPGTGVYNIGIFGTISENTLLKNITIGIAKRVASDTDNVFTMFFDHEIAGTPTLNIGLLAGQNNGIITNARIIPVISRSLNRTHSAELFDLGNGIIIERISYERANLLTRAKAILFPLVSVGAATINAGSLVGLNNGFITNCQVETDFHVGETGTGPTFRANIMKTLGELGDNQTDFVNITGSMGVLNFGGFVGVNNKNVSSSYVKGADLTALSTAGFVGGFVAYNFGEINYCFVEGSVPDQTGLITREQHLRLTGRKIKSALVTGGFVNVNSGYIGNSYANIKIEDSANNAGFVWQHRKLNEAELPAGGILSEAVNAIEYCFTLAEPPVLNNSQMFAFVGLLPGIDIARIDNSFWLEFDNARGVDIGSHISTNNTRAGAFVNELEFFEDDQKFSGYAFSEADGDGAIWKREVSHSINGVDYKLPRLLPAEHRASSLRSHIRKAIAVDGSRVDYYSYIDDAYQPGRANTHYIGSYNNPNLIYDSDGFNKIMEVAEEMKGSGVAVANTGFYRFVKNVDMAGIHSDSHFATIRGQIDGNGMTVSNIHANGGAATLNVPDAIGLFGVIESDPDIKMIAGVRGLRLELNEVFAAQIPFVGGLAGRVSNANIFDIQVRPNPNRVSSYVMGQNIVGGVLGLVDGTSRVFGISSSIGVFSTYNYATMKEDFAMGSNLRARARRFDIRPEYRTSYDDLICIDDSIDGSTCKEEGHEHTFVKVYHQMSYAGGAIGALNTKTRQVEEDTERSTAPDGSIIVGGKTEESVFTPRPNASSIYVNNAWVDGVFTGGVAGYVGEDAKVTGLNFVAGADSFINGITVSGGTIGENRGNVMFLVATFEKEVQDKIDAVLGDTSSRDGLDFGTFTQNSAVFGRAASRGIGGLVGLNYGGLIRHAQSELPIDNSLSFSSGGIVGINTGGEIEYAIATASVCASRSRAAGGLVGTAIAYNEETFESIEGAILPYLLDKPLAIRDSYAINGYNPNAATQAPSGGTYKGGIVGYINGGEDAISLTASARNWYNPFFYSSLLLDYNYDENDISTSINWNGGGAVSADISNVFDGFSVSDIRKILKAEDRSLISIHFDMPEFWKINEDAVGKTRFPYIYSFINPYANTEFVSNWADLAKAADKANKESTTNMQIILLNHLSASSRPATQPVFNNFNGSFIGRAGGTNNRTEVQINTALFDNLNNAKFKDILFTVAGGNREVKSGGAVGMVANKSTGSKFENVGLNMSSNVLVSSSMAGSIGGLVGYSTGIDTFSNVDIDGFRIKTSGDRSFNIGGLVGSGGSVSIVGGDAKNIVIDASSATASANTLNIGGLVGNATGYVNILGAQTDVVEISGSISTAAITSDWSRPNIGGFVGVAGGKSIINYVKSDIAIKTSSNYDAIGGIVGHAKNTTINNAQVLKVSSFVASSGPATIGNGYLGIFGGVMEGGSRLYASEFTNTPAVDTLNGSLVVGAIAGWLDGGTLSYCFADINVSTSGTGTNRIAGGLVGKMSEGSLIERCFTNNKVQGYIVGGLVGQNNGGKIALSYSTSRLQNTSTDATGAVGGLAGYSNGGEFMSSYFAGRILTNQSGCGLIIGNSGTTATLVSQTVYGLEEIAGAMKRNGATVLPLWSSDSNNRNTLSQTRPGGINSNWIVGKHASPPHLPYIADTDDDFVDAQQNNKNSKAVFATAANLADTSTAENSIYIVDAPLSIASQLSAFDGILIGIGNREIEIAVTGTTSLFASLNGALVANLTIKNANLAANMTNSFVNKIYTTGNVTATVNGFGGIINTINSGVLTLSHSDMTINAASRANIGGLVGSGTSIAANAASVQILNSFFSGEIYGVNGQAGTILGCNNATLHNVYSTGSVLGTVTANYYDLNGAISSIYNSFSISFVQAGTTDTTKQQNTFSLQTQSWYSQRVGGTANTSWLVSTHNNYFPLLNDFREQDQRQGSRINPHKISQEIPNNSTSANSAFADMRKAEFKNDAFILTSDITFVQGSNNVPQANFNTIGEFAGTLYGNNKTITNMTITTGQAARVPEGVGNLYGGMFSVLDNAFVSNMTFVNATVVVAQAQNVGIVAGEIKARSIVAGISWNSGVMFAGATQSANAQDSATQTDARVWGLVGRTTDSVVGSRIARSAAARIYEAGALVAGSGGRGNVLPTVAVDGITTAAELQEALNKHTSSTVISLSGNITMSDDSWVGITDFFGTFEGNGYIISGLTGNPFVRYNRGIIRNVIFENANINSSYGGGGNAGGIVAAENYGQIHNVFAFGAIRYGFTDVGSIVGANHSAAGDITAFGAVWADKSNPIGIIGGQY